MKKNMKTMLCFGLMIAFVIAMSALLIGCAVADPDATTEVTTEATTETTTETTEATTEATTEETTEATEETTEATEETTEATENENTGAADGGNGEQGGSVENTGNAGNAGNTGNTTETKPAETTPAGPTLPPNKPGSCEHNWSDWVTTSGATTTKEGSQLRTCSKCGKSETQTIPKVYINAAELAAAGNSYAASLGFVVDASLNSSNAGYFAGIDMPLTTMADGYSYMATSVASTKSQLMAGDYYAGRTDSPDTFLPYRCNCEVTYAGESEMGPVYIFWCYYG